MTQILAQKLTLPGTTGSITGPIADGKMMSTIGGIIGSAVPFVFAFAGIGLLAMLILGGFDFLTSAGDPKKLEGGKQKIVNAIIGFMIIFAAFWIVQIFGIVFGLDAIKSLFGK